MKKVLIISYYFPPGNFAGSYRVKSWADYLHLFDYYPIIITRHWDENETDYTAISSKKEIEKEENKHYVVYRLPYKGSWRDRFVKRFGRKARILGRFLTFFQLLLQNFFLKAIPYHNFYFLSREILIKEKDIRSVIISGNPFHQFRFGYLLKKEFPTVHWIADYRDEWTSYRNYSERKDPLWKKIFLIYDGFLEKRWVNQADLITSVSEIWVNQIKEYLRFKGSVGIILNGYDPADFEKHDWSKISNKNTFILLYSGTIYPFQKLSVLLKGIVSFLSKLPGNSPVEVVFSGLNENRRTPERIKRFFKGYENYLKILPRISKNQFLNFLNQSSILLLFPYLNVPGCYSSKVFEYLASRRPILMAPTDGFLSNLIEQTNSGFVANSMDEAEKYLLGKFQEFMANKSFMNVKSPETFFYSRIKQTEFLAEHLKTFENE